MPRDPRTPTPPSPPGDVTLPSLQDCLRRPMERYKAARTATWAEFYRLPGVAAAVRARHAAPPAPRNRDLDEAWVDVFRDNDDVAQAAGAPAPLMDRFQRLEAGLSGMERAAIDAANRTTGNLRYTRVVVYAYNGQVQHTVARITADKTRPAPIRKLIQVTWNDTYTQEAIQSGRVDKARKAVDRNQSWLAEQLDRIATTAEERRDLARLLRRAQLSAAAAPAPALPRHTDP